MYNNSFAQNLNMQATRERLDNQISQLQQLRDQLTQSNQPTSINQTFQLAGSSNVGMRYVNSIEDVSKEIVYNDTPFFSHDLTVLWIKNPKGDIKAYEMKEIVKKDEKDMIIENLQLQINQMKEELKNVTIFNTNVDESDQSEQPTNVSTNRSSKKK